MKTLVHTEKEHIEEIIRSCDVCFVGLADTDGTPYVIPMNFGYRNGVIYLHSAQEGRSISILERNPKVASPSAPTMIWYSSIPKWLAATVCVPKALSHGVKCGLKKTSTRKRKRWI